MLNRTPFTDHLKLIAVRLTRMKLPGKQPDWLKGAGMKSTCLLAQSKPLPGLGVGRAAEGCSVDGEGSSCPQPGRTFLEGEGVSTAF